MALVERIAQVIREGRQCGTKEEPLMVPCPFCRWGPDAQTDDHDETGCIWIAESVLTEIERVRRGFLP